MVGLLLVASAGVALPRLSAHDGAASAAGAGTAGTSLAATSEGTAGKSAAMGATGMAAAGLGAARMGTAGMGRAGMTAGAGTYVPANPPVTGVVPSHYRPPNAAHHEFQANCAPVRDLPDDPIVHPGRPGASHLHTFMGNTTTDANTTLASLQAGGTSCRVLGDRSGYWMPTLYDGNRVVDPVGPQIIYYKSGVTDYTSVRPFPPGLRYLAGSPMATPAEFGPNSPEGWTCGNSFNNTDFPASCPAGSRLLVRYRAPSCWDGRYLDTPDHKSHLAYPVDGACPADHPVAVPLLEFKMAYPGSADQSHFRLSSGRGYSFHFDFYNAWDPATLAALVTHCIGGGLQCDGRGYDQHHPQVGAALDQQYELPGSHTVLSRSGWTATASVTGGRDVPQNMLDGNARTRWTSGTPMASGQSVTVDMHATHAIDQVFVDSAGSFADYARRYQVYLSVDGGTWAAPVASGAGYLPQINTTFARQNARYIKIVQTGSSDSWWSIAELTAAS